MTQPHSFNQVVRSGITLGIAFGLGIGILLLLRPFIIPLASGAIVALITRPLYLVIHRKLKIEPLSALITLLILLVIVMLPVAIVLSLLLKEISNLTDILQQPNFSFGQIESSFSNFVLRLGLPVNLSHLDIQSVLLKVINYIGGQSTAFIGGVAGLLGTLFLTIVTAFYLLQNHDEIEEQVNDFSPLSPKDTQHIWRRAKEVIRATVNGNLILIIIQAVSSTIGLSIFQIGTPVLLGALYGLASLIPAIGTSLIWIPIFLFEIITGNVFVAIGIAAWSLLQVIFFDNFLGPRLIQKRANLHPFLVLIGVLGGVAQFGLLGIILGPTVIAVGIVGLEIVHRTWQAQPE